MKKHVKRSLISLILCATMSCVIGAFAAMSSFKAKAEAPAYYTLDGFTINEEAAVRSSDPNGIRFTTELSGETKAAIAELGLSNVSYGTLILPADFLGSGELTHSTPKVVDSKTTKWHDDKQTKYTSVLVGEDNGDGTFDNLPESYYNRPLAARSYVKGTKDGQTVTYYTENTAVRSMGYVAYMAQLGGHNTDLIKGIVDLTEVKLEFTNERISAYQNSANGTMIIENAIPQSTTTAAVVTVGGIPLPAEFLEENNITISYTSNSDAISVNGQTLTAEKVGSAEITASVSFTLNGKKVDRTVTKEMSTEGYEAQSTYKILISEAASNAQLNQNTSYLPAKTEDAYNAYYLAFEKTAAYKLQAILEEATGIKLEIVTATGEEGVKYISVGKTSLATSFDVSALKDTEAKMQVIDGNVILCGKTPEGTLYGVQRWLYDNVGYEYYTANTYVVNHNAEIVASNTTFTRDIAFQVGQTEELEYGNGQGTIDDFAMRSYTQKIVPVGTIAYTDAEQNPETEEWTYYDRHEDDTGFFYKGIAHNSTLVVNGDTYNTSNNYNKNTGSPYYKWYATDSDTSYNSASSYLKPYRTVKYKTIPNPYREDGYDSTTDANKNDTAAEKTQKGTATIKAELCYTAHGDSTERGKMVEHVASAMYNQMQKFPLYDRIGFAQADHRIWCECDGCKAQGSATDNLLSFLLEVAASLETKLTTAGDARATTFKICTLFYHATNAAPTTNASYLDARMKHMEVWFAETAGDHFDALNGADETAADFDSPWNDAVYTNLQGWSAVCNQYGADMLWWHYYANTDSQFIPFNTINAMRYNYGIAMDAGVDYIFNQMMTFNTNWAGLKYYLMSKLNVNAKPTDDTWNGWLNSYFEGSYGPGAAKMREYFNAWNTLTESEAVEDKFKNTDAYDPYKGDGASMATDARQPDEWNTIWTTGELTKWIGYIDAALAALDVTDPNYETYYRNIMLEKLVPMYLLMWIHDGYTPVLTSDYNDKAYKNYGHKEYFVIDASQAGSFTGSTYVSQYGEEFITWVKEWNARYGEERVDAEGKPHGWKDARDAEGIGLRPFITAIENKLGLSNFDPSTQTHVLVSDLVVAEMGKNVTLSSAALTDGTYTVSGTLTTATSATASNGQVTVLVGNVEVGKTYNVTFTDGSGNTVTFNNVMVASSILSANAGAVQGSGNYYVIDKTYYIEEGKTDLKLTHGIFTKGSTYTVAANNNTTSATVFYAGSLNATIGAMLNGEQCWVSVVDSNNNTYVFNVLSAEYIRTVEQLQELGVGGWYNVDADGNIVASAVLLEAWRDSKSSGNDKTGAYVLANDIDCAGAIIHPGHNYGNSNFVGIFDGQGYTISNFMVGDGGIFGGLNGATIRNVNIENVTVDIRHAVPGWNYGAVFANTAENTVIENVNVQFDEVITGVGYKDSEDGTGTKYHTGLLIANGTENVAYKNVNLNIANCPADRDNKKIVTSIFGSKVDTATTTFSNVTIFISQTVSDWMDGQYGGIIYGYSDDKETAILSAPNGVTVSEKSFAITNTETTVGVGETLTITTDNEGYSYSYALKDEVAGISVNGSGVVTVAGTVKAGTTFTVVVTEADGWSDEITLTAVKVSKTFATVYTVVTTGDDTTNADTTIEFPADIEGTVLKVTLGDGFVAYDKAQGIGSINGNVVTPDSMPVKREHLGKGIAYNIETVDTIYTGSINVYTQVINTKEEFKNFETVAANNSVKAGYVVEEQKYAYLSGYFVLGNDIAYNDVWYPALAYANVPHTSQKGTIYGLCNQSNSNVKGWIEQYGEDRVISMDGWTNTETAGFHATLDGDGHSIIGMQTTGAYNGLSVLGGSNGVVKDISFTQVSVGDSSNILFGFSKATIENVYIQVASMASGNSGEGATTLIGYTSNTGATVRNVIIDATKCDITGLTRAYFVSLGICNAEGVYVIGGGAGLAETTKDLATPAAFWDKTASDTAAKFDTTAALLADGTHGAVAKAFDIEFWTIDEVNGIVCPNALYDDILAELSKIELNDTITIEQVRGSFTLPNEVEGTVTSVTVGSTELTNISGKTVTLSANDLVQQGDLGENVKVTIETSSNTYVGYANVYTMIIDNATELDTWMETAAENAVKAGLVIEAQKGLTYSGYFVLGDNIDYNKTWTPYKTYGSLWALCYQNKEIFNDPAEYGAVIGQDSSSNDIKNYDASKSENGMVAGAIQEDWGKGDLAGFKGVFDGNGRYIAGMSVSGQYNGFIVTMGGGTIKDVAFTNASVGASAGFVFNRGKGSVENVYVEVASIASGASTGSYTVLLGGYQNGTIARTLRNVVVDMSKANLDGINYATVANLANFKASGVYVIGADELTFDKINFSSDAAASVFLNCNVDSGNSADYDIAGSFATAADLMADGTHGAYVTANFSSSFWTVTADSVTPNCLAGSYDAQNRVTVDLGYVVSGTAVTQATEATLDLSEVAGILDGKTVSIKSSDNVIYEGTISGNSVTIDPTQITAMGDSIFVIEYSGGQVNLPVYLDGSIELNQANVGGSPSNLKTILNSKLDGHFVLTSHLNMGGDYLQAIDVFTGILDGNGYGITNTYINVSGNSMNAEGVTNEAYSPNFIYCNEGTIKNLHIQLNDFAWTDTTYEPQGKYYGNGHQGIVAVNSGTIENVYVDVTLQWSSGYTGNGLRGILTKQNNGTITNVIMKATLAEGKTLYDNAMAAITANNSGTITNAYVVTNGANLVVADPVQAFATIYDLPTATIDAWGDMWNTSAYTDLPVFGKGYIVDGSDTLVTFGGTGLDVPTYVGSPTEVGFADTDTILAAPMAGAWNDRIIIGGSKVADYLVFDFAVATVPGSWVAWLHKDKKMVSGYSYLVYPNGNTPYVNEPAENKEAAAKAFYIVDEDGNFVTSTISANTKYTMYVHLGGNVDVDGIMLGGDNCGTFYIANVRYANGREQVITQGNSTTKMSLYMGDVETLGFEKGTIVQQMVTNDLVAGSQWWDSENYPDNLHRATTSKAHIAADGTQNAISIDFIVSEAIASGEVFYVWGEGLASGAFGSVSVNKCGPSGTSPNFKASIVERDTGSPVNSLQPDTVYTLSMYMPGATSYNVGSITASGMTTYFSLSSIRTNNADPISTDLGANPLLLPEYQGDVTALGFEEGTTVFTSVQDSRTDMWNSDGALGVSMATQAITLTKAANEDYASVQFSVSRAFTGTYAFFTWWYNENGNQGGGGYLNINGTYSAGGTTMPNPNAYAFDLETGLQATSFVPGKAYEIRWYGEGAVKYQLACCEQNGETITIYYANPSSGNDVETTGDVVYDTNGKALQYYYGDVTKLGFAEGTLVQGRTEEYDLVGGADNWWQSGTAVEIGGQIFDCSNNPKRQTAQPVIYADADYDVVCIKFALSEAVASGNVFYVWSYNEAAAHLGGGAVVIGQAWAETGFAAAIYDAEGNIATSLEANTVYVLKLRMEGAYRYNFANIVESAMTTYLSGIISYEN